MNNLSFVLRRVEAGWTVRFRQDFFGGQHVELSWGWLRWPNKRVKLSAEELATVKAALSRRWEARRRGKPERVATAA